MLVIFPSTFNNLCRDHVGILNARSMAIKLKIVNLHLMYTRTVEKGHSTYKSTQFINTPNVFTVMETMVQIHLTVQLILSKKK